MKARKIALSLVAVAGLMSVGANAGQLSVTSVEKFASELTVGQPYSIGLKDLNMTYTYQYGSPIKGGNIVVNVTGGSIVDEDNVTKSHLFYKAGDGNHTIDFYNLSSDGRSITYKIDDNTTLPSGAVLNFCAEDTNESNMSLTVTLDKDSKGLQFQVTVSNVNGDPKDSSRNIYIAQGVQELSANLGGDTTYQYDSKFTGNIDPSMDYKYFINNTVQDKAGITLARSKSVSGSGYGIGDVNATVSLYASNKITDFGQLIVKNAANILSTCSDFVQDGDKFRKDCKITNWKKDDNSSVVGFEFTADKTHIIKETDFWVGVKVDTTAKNPDYTATLLNKVNFGSWVNYGYRARIQEMLANNDFISFVKFTNIGSTDANVYITAMDWNGNKATISSKDGDIPALPAGHTVKYKLNDFLSAIKDKNPDVDTSKSVLIKVNIPVNPSSVIGYAFQRYVPTSKFRNLLIYDNSTYQH